MKVKGSTPASSCRRRRHLLAAGLAAALAASAQAETNVLTHFTLIDGTGRSPVADQALVITDGRLRWVGPASRLRAPAGGSRYAAGLSDGIAPHFQ